MSPEIKKAAELLRNGGLVAFPTETVYGLGADALNVNAVVRIFEAKNRPTFDPLIVHVLGLSQAQKLTTGFPPLALRLAHAFWPGPLTLILPKNNCVPDLVTSGLPSVALRVPNHPLALDLLREFGGPLAAPSANLFGQVSPTTAEHVRQGLGNKVDCLLDGGPCAVGVESTILSFLDEGPPRLLRPGGLPVEEIENLIGKVQRESPAPEAPLAPGQCKNHYATRTPLFLEANAPGESAPGRKGYLGLAWPHRPELYERIEVIAPNGDLKEAAAHLFAAMRRLDEAGLDFIVARPAPNEGLGRAINDRLFKASQK